MKEELDRPSPSKAIFVGRQTYRRRRLMDAARFLPVVGVLLWCVPLLWGNSGDDQAVHVSSATTYIFVVWTVLIVFGLWMSFPLKAVDTAEDGRSDPS